MSIEQDLILIMSIKNFLKKTLRLGARKLSLDFYLMKKLAN